MKRKLPALFTTAALGLVMLACQSPFSPAGPEAATAPALPSQPAASGISTLPPTRTPPLAPTLTERLVVTPTLKSADLSAVKIELKDLPPDFQAVDVASQEQIGLTEATLGAYFTGAFSQAQPANYFAYLNAKPETFEVVLGLLFTPLTGDEAATFDNELSDPALAMQTFGANFGGAAEIIQGSDQVGQKSAGFTFLSQTGTLSMRGDLYLARRENVASVVLVLYQDGKQPPMPAAGIAAFLDARLKAAFNQ